MPRRLTPSRSAYGSLSEVCVLFGVWHLVEKVGPVRHTEARRKVCLARRMGPLGPLGKCALLGVWRPVEARILCGVGRKRRNGARLHEFGNVLPGNATMGPFLGRIFFGSLFGKLRDLAFC